MRALALVLALLVAATTSAQPRTTVTEEALLFHDFAPDANAVGYGSIVAALDLPGGGLVAVSAARALDTTGRWETGAVAVFRRDGGAGWVEDAVLRPGTDPGWVRGYGSGLDAVTLPGGDALLLVGAPDYNPVQAREHRYGGVYLLRRDAQTGVWDELGVVSPDGLDGDDRFGNGGDEFGSIVDAEVLDGGRVRMAVAADGRLDDRNGREGLLDHVVLVVEQREAEVWASDGWDIVAELAPPEEIGYEGFGWQIALSGDVVLVGALAADVDGVADVGRAYAFGRDAETGAWSHQATLTPPDAVEDASMGWDVALVETAVGLVALVPSHRTVDGRFREVHTFVQGPPQGGTPEREWTRGPVLTASLAAQREGFGTGVVAAPLARGRASIMITSVLAPVDGRASGSATTFVLAPAPEGSLGEPGGLVVEQESALLRPTEPQSLQYFGGTGTRQEAALTPGGLVAVGSRRYRRNPGSSGAVYAFDVSDAFAVADEDAPSPTAGLSVSVAPNPSRGGAVVTASRGGTVRVSVVDVLGREVAVLHDGPAAAGSSWALPALRPGAYAVRVATADGVAVAWATVAR